MVSALNTARPSAGGALATATVRQGQPRGGRGGAGGARGGVALVSGGGGVGRGGVALVGGGGGGGWGGWPFGAPLQMREQAVRQSPIQISDSSETSEDSEDEEDDEEDHFAFGRCFRCGESVILTILTFT